MNIKTNNNCQLCKYIVNDEVNIDKPNNIILKYNPEIINKEINNDEVNNNENNLKKYNINFNNSIDDYILNYKYFDNKLYIDNSYNTLYLINNFYNYKIEEKNKKISNIIFGIDIGTNNFSISIRNQSNITVVDDYEKEYILHILIDLNSKLKLQLINKIKLIIETFILLPYINMLHIFNIKINIEKQVSFNSSCCKIQNTIETILNMYNIKYNIIDSKLKYNKLKEVYNLDKIVKKDLIKYINLDKEKCLYYKINIDNKNNFLYFNLNVKKNNKYDDIIDSKILSNL